MEADEALANMGALQHAEALEPVALAGQLQRAQAYHRHKDAGYDGSKAEILQSRVHDHAVTVVESGHTTSATTYTLGLETAPVVLPLRTVNTLTGIEEATGDTDALRSYERVQLVTLGPSSYDEAVAVIPSLGRFLSQAVQQLLAELEARIAERDALPK